MKSIDEEPNRISTKRNPKQNVSALSALWFHLIPCLGIVVGFSIAHHVYSIDLVSRPDQTLQILLVIECPIAVLLWSVLRHDPSKCSYLRAVGRGLLGLPAGSLVLAFGAIALGAPVGIKYLSATVYWSLLMSSLTVVPTAAVFGSYFADWQCLYANSRPAGSVDYMLCVPAHGALLGCWFGAWPMPLDWERPWQEWPVCVTYGGVAGYVMGLCASLGLVLLRSRRRKHAKGE